jgi:ABC-2 type transport system ATP-binding protein
VQARPEKARDSHSFMRHRSVNSLMRTWAADRATNQASRSVRCAVEASGVVVVYGRAPVLLDLDVIISEGESIAVMGPNGAGKSTLLKCLVGAVRPRAGRVCWFGMATTTCSHVRRQIGYVGQEYGLYAELTAWENLLFAGRMNGVAHMRDRAGALLSDAGLESQAHRRAGQLSQGMRQRLAIARALVHEPQLIVLDEPSSNLDAAGLQWLERLFEHWRCAGRAVCFASHDVAQGRSLAHRIIHLDAGRILAIERGDCPSTTLRRSA